MSNETKNYKPVTDFNKVTVSGRLSKDPDNRKFEDGKQQTIFRIVVNREWMDDNGTKQSRPTWIDCRCRGKTAENAIKWLKKGRKVLVHGSLEMGSWEDKTTHQKRYEHKIFVETFMFLDSRGGGNNGNGLSSEEGEAGSVVSDTESSTVEYDVLAGASSQTDPAEEAPF